jgi:hypothetical protein
MIFRIAGPDPSAQSFRHWTWVIGLWTAVGSQRCIPPQFLVEAITPFSVGSPSGPSSRWRRSGSLSAVRRAAVVSESPRREQR